MSVRTASLLLVASWLCLFQPAVALAAHPEVLVVYNTNYADSLSVANHYMAQRAVPPANLCAVASPDTDTVSMDQYASAIQSPVQACLNALGPKSILYIVLAYAMPYRLLGPSPFGLASVDSYLADVWNKYATQPFLLYPSAPHSYYADSQSQGGVYQPFLPLTSYRANPRSALIYSVWRLDGPSTAIATALVDQAIAAEGTGGPQGQACIDRQYGDLSAIPDAGIFTGDWDLRMAANFLQQAGITVVEDSHAEEFGTSPAPLTCPNTAFYSGWYSYNHYNDAFTWQTGSIGWHMDSAAALSPRGGPSWAPNALQRGIAVTSGSVTEPYLQGMVRPGGTFRNLLEGANVGDAFLRNTRWLKWSILNIGDPLYRPFAGGRAPFSPLQPADSFALAPQEVVGGKSSTGTITLHAAAPAGGATFALDTGGASIASVPASVTVAAGATSVKFPIATAGGLNGYYGVILTAAGAGLTLHNTLTLDPLFGSVVGSATVTSAGIPVAGTVILNGAAPLGGVVVSLSSDTPAVASVPASVTVPAGTAVASFTVTTVPVAAATNVNISAAYGGVGGSFGFQVVPAITWLRFTSATVNAGDPVGIEIFLGSPAPAGGATIQLTNSDPASLPAPATMVLAAGTTYQDVPLFTDPGAHGKTVNVTGTYGGAAVTATLRIN